MILFWKVSKGNNLISKSRAFHNVGAAYTKDLSKNELSHVLLIGGTHNKQGSKDARVRIVVLLTLTLTDVNLVVRLYDASLSSLLHKHEPSKRIYVVERPMNDWMTDDILVLKALRRKYESLWRKTRLTVHFVMYSGTCMDVKTAISKGKSEILQKTIRLQ